MCGITGVLGFDNTIEISETKLRNMAYSLKYRGPDKEFSSIPYRYLLNNSTNKYITKKIAEKYFDNDFICREKMGKRVL